MTESSNARDQMRVLVVDDDVIARESLKSWFEGAGHAVSAVAASDALALLRSHRWDLALVDVKMPMDLELPRRIHDASSDTTLIVMTAPASVETAVQALKEGAHDCITKPFDPEYLRHRVRRIAERRRLIRENITLKRQLADMVAAGADATDPVDNAHLALSAVERAHVARVLRTCGWNISKTARVLEVDRATVYNKIKQYGLSRDRS